jgi:transcriptional regulator with XRE-family HTH domain
MAQTSPSLIDAEPASLATRLKQLRTQRGWTLAQLSKLTKLSKPYLSRLEVGQRQPSLAALLTLGRIFDTPIRSILDSTPKPPSSPVVIQSGRASIQRANGLRYRAVSGGGAMLNLSAMHVTVPRRRRKTALARHDGEELLYVLSGALDLVLDHEIHTLQAGDSAHFDARIPHRLSAIGDRDAEVLVIAYAPTPQAHAAETMTKTTSHKTTTGPRHRDQTADRSASMPICASLAGS